MIKKLRNVTPEEWSKYIGNYSCELNCCDCIFNYGNCSDGESGWVNHKEMYSDKFLDQEIEIEMPPKTIPRGCISKRWKWIARDEDGDLFVFENKPKKEKLRWYDNNGSYYDVSSLMDNELENIQWSDDEPTKIED